MDKTSYRDYGGVRQYQFLIGSQPYPVAPISVDTSDCSETIAETLKSFALLPDIRASSVLSSQNFYNGCAVYSCDFEGSPTEFLESGVNTSSNALSITLNIDFHTPNALPAGNIVIVCAYDQSLTLLSNGNLIRTM